jgi:hypothetical protein
MVYRPILTNGSTVWWTRVNYNISRMELNELQSLACLAVTGAVKITPTAAMEVIMGLLPVHMIIKVQAQAGINQWRPTSTNYGHAKKLGT